MKLELGTSEGILERDVQQRCRQAPACVEVPAVDAIAGDGTAALADRWAGFVRCRGGLHVGTAVRAVRTLHLVGTRGIERRGIQLERRLRDMHCAARRGIESVGAGVVVGRIAIEHAILLHVVYLAEGHRDVVGRATAGVEHGFAG
ncbi:MAG: hypothetical protein WDO12_06730 [Pseudomonadota bacterium]